jgi:hypothetical protein
MEAIINESGLTGRVTRVELTAGSFADERILRFLVDGLAHDGTLFELTRNGEPVGTFTFNKGKAEDE